MIQFDPSLTQGQADALAWAGVMGGGENAVIDQSTGLVVNSITGENLSTVAWSNLSITERLNIVNLQQAYRASNQSCL